MTVQSPRYQAAPQAPALQAPALPRAGRRDGVAPLVGNRAELLHRVLFIAGAVLLPGGLIVIGLGWYGVAHTPYTFDQMAYLVSGGILGLGITFVGGFLYFGSWLARIAADQKEAQRQLSETLLLLADSVSHNTAAVGSLPVELPAAPPAPTSAPTPAPSPPAAAPTHAAPRVAAPPARPRDPGAVLVVVGTGTTVHRADCDLIAGRDDLRVVGPEAAELTPCRLCSR